MPKPLDDIDTMPFGMHKGKRMQDVPASYFHYLWTTGLREVKPYAHGSGKLHSDNNSRVADYIRRNLIALKQEHKDGVWD